VGIKCIFIKIRRAASRRARGRSSAAIRASRRVEESESPVRPCTFARAIPGACESVPSEPREVRRSGPAHTRSTSATRLRPEEPLELFGVAVFPLIGHPARQLKHHEEVVEEMARRFVAVGVNDAVRLHDPEGIVMPVPHWVRPCRISAM